MKLVIEHTDYLFDEKLSLAAKEVLTLMIALPEEKRSRDYIRSISYIDDAEWQLDNALTELINAGYINNTEVQI